VNEIGNAVTELNLHHQLLDERSSKPEFQKSLGEAVGKYLKRIMRLKIQMDFLAKKDPFKQEVVVVKKLVEDAFQEAADYQETAHPQSTIGVQLKLENPGKSLTVMGARAALQHALSEIMLNALQAAHEANQKNPKIDVTLQTVGTNNGRSVTIEVQDNGRGFDAEAAKKIPTPFYANRVGGVGLGLSVTQKIIEKHHGKLEIVPAESGVVRVSLPLPTATN
jgi:C4-dicarboxylate-specific signal transduction histidine kinase